MSASRPPRNYLDPYECIWLEGNILHVDCPKMMEALKIPDTPEGRRAVDRAIEDIAREAGMKTENCYDLP